MEAADERLLAAYHRTTYWVAIPSGLLGIRIGQPHVQLDTLLANAGVADWALITAENPRSVQLSAIENQARHAELCRLTQASNWPTFASESRADDDDWPAEKGLLVLGIGPADALVLARLFGQFAFLTGRRGSSAKLVLSEEDYPQIVRKETESSADDSDGEEDGP